MSDIGLIMNALLGVLLIGALAVGWRLEGRLKALRASHQSFSEAVGDLDRAAARAEQGLADLRAATDEAAESLAARIERAGALAQRLERLTGEAANAERRLAEAPKPAPAPVRETAVRRFAERYGAVRAANPTPPASARHDLILEDDEGSAPAPAPVRAASPRPAATNERLERLRALARPRPDPAHLARRAEEDLFDAPEPRRAAGGLR